MILTMYVGNFSILIQIAKEQAVDQGGLSQSGFPDHHQRKIESTFDGFSMHLLWQCGETDIIPVSLEHITTPSHKPHFLTNKKSSEFEKKLRTCKKIFKFCKNNIQHL